MELKRGQMGLDIPVQNAVKRANLPMQPDVLIKWRATLPMADTSTTAKKVFFMLNEVNQTALDLNTRFELLEILRPPVQLICQALRKHYVNQVAFNKQKLTIANLAQTLQTEMANGYKLIIEEIYLHEEDKNQENILPASIYRIMHYYILILLRCYQLYVSPPEGVWRELHLLYKYAEKVKLLKNKVGYGTSTSGAAVTLLNCYKHALLLAASNPYQWKQSDLEIINNVLDNWSHYAELKPYQDLDQNTPSIYIVDYMKDLPPSPLGLNQIELSKTCMIFDLKKTSIHVEEIFKEAASMEDKGRVTNDINPEYSISVSTLERLLASWKSAVIRKYKRFEMHREMQVAFSLSATHYYINGEESFDPQGIAKKTVEVYDSFSLSPEVTFLEDNQNEFTLETVSLSSETKKQREQFSVFTCTTVNISPAGLCLLWEGDAYPCIQPGEIAAIKANDDIDTNLWSIVVVRWLKYDKQRRMKIGLQLLAPYAKAAAAQVLKNGEPVGYFLRCLILPEMKDLGFKSTIITPILPFKEGKFVVLRTKNNSDLFKTKLTKRIDATSSYKQFEYESEKPIIGSKKESTIDQEEQKLESLSNQTNGLKLIDSDDKNNQDKDFDSIWDKI